MKTIQMTTAEIAERTARFNALQPMSTMKDNERVSQAAKDIIFARKIMPNVLERTKNPFGDTAAIFGAGGLTMNISVCPPGHRQIRGSLGGDQRSRRLGCSEKVARGDP